MRLQDFFKKKGGDDGRRKPSCPTSHRNRTQRRLDMEPSISSAKRTHVVTAAAHVQPQQNRTHVEVSSREERMDISRLRRAQEERSSLRSKTKSPTSDYDKSLCRSRSLGSTIKQGRHLNQSRPTHSEKVLPKEVSRKPSSVSSERRRLENKSPAKHEPPLRRPHTAGGHRTHEVIPSTPAPYLQSFYPDPSQADLINHPTRRPPLPPRPKTAGVDRIHEGVASVTVRNTLEGADRPVLKPQTPPHRHQKLDQTSRDRCAQTQRSASTRSMSSGRSSCESSPCISIASTAATSILPEQAIPLNSRQEALRAYWRMGFAVEAEICCPTFASGPRKDQLYHCFKLPCGKPGRISARECSIRRLGEAVVFPRSITGMSYSLSPAAFADVSQWRCF